MNRSTTITTLITAAPALPQPPAQRPINASPVQPFVPPQLTFHGTIAGLTQQFTASCEDLDDPECMMGL